MHSRIPFFFTVELVISPGNSFGLYYPQQIYGMVLITDRMWFPWDEHAPRASLPVKTDVFRA